MWGRPPACSGLSGLFPRRSQESEKRALQQRERMEDEDAKALRLARPTAEDILCDLTEQQLEDIRRRVRAGIDSIRPANIGNMKGAKG